MDLDFLQAESNKYKKLIEIKLYDLKQCIKIIRFYRKLVDELDKQINAYNGGHKCTYQ